MRYCPRCQRTHPVELQFCPHKRSRYVEQEWRHALGLERAGFIRPVYWEEPMPHPPPEVNALHFARLGLEPAGVGARVTSFFYYLTRR